MRANARSAITYVLLATVVVVCLAVPAGGEPLGGQNPPTKVSMVDGDRFRPRTVTIERGTAVRWVNKDNLDHTSTGPGWNSRLDPGESFRRTFNRRGTFTYRCTLHFSMQGTITVE